MKKTNAAKVLPVSLLRQVQCYVQGETLYIPALKEQRKAWGERSGIRRQLQKRNQQIIADHRQGCLLDTSIGCSASPMMPNRSVPYFIPY